MLRKILTIVAGILSVVWLCQLPVFAMNASELWQDHKEAYKKHIDAFADKSSFEDWAEEGFNDLMVADEINVEPLERSSLKESGKARCTVATFKNIDFSQGGAVINFHFHSDIMPNHLCFEGCSGDFNSVLFSSRAVIPSIYKEASSEVDEYYLSEVIFDGTGLSLKSGSLDFMLNKDRDITPIGIYFEHCSGFIRVCGPEGIADRFHLSEDSKIVICQFSDSAFSIYI